MLNPEHPALILAPMDGVTDAAMRALQGEISPFTFAVSEFQRVAQNVPPAKVFYKHVPELCRGGFTPGGLPVQVQILGGDAGRMAEAAFIAYEAGAKAVDINFGCPAPTVNRHDGGATLLNHPRRIREIVAAVRAALPASVPVSAKLRLGWDSIEDIHENAEMAAQGGASWLTIHGRTRTARYLPPIYWEPIGKVRKDLQIPVVANGDIWDSEDFRRCRETTGCLHFMLGRGALANPPLVRQAAQELGLIPHDTNADENSPCDWAQNLTRFMEWIRYYDGISPRFELARSKQWLKLASLYGAFQDFDRIKHAQSMEEIFAALASAAPSPK